MALPDPRTRSVPSVPTRQRNPAVGQPTDTPGNCPSAESRTAATSRSDANPPCADSSVEPPRPGDPIAPARARGRPHQDTTRGARDGRRGDPCGRPHQDATHGARDGTSPSPTVAFPDAPVGSRSGRGDGIAPVTPPTPPDKRFSRIRRLAPVDVTGVRPRRLRGARRHSVLSFTTFRLLQPCRLRAVPQPESTGGLPFRGRPLTTFQATRDGCRGRLPACLLRLRPFAPAAFTAFVATMASADFCPSLNRQISPGKVHGLSGRAVGLYPARLSVTVGFRGS